MTTSMYSMLELELSFHQFFGRYACDISDGHPMAGWFEEIIFDNNDIGKTALFQLSLFAR